MLLISQYVIKINMKIIDTIKKIISIIFLPIKFVFKQLKHIFIRPVTFLFINIRKIFKNFGIKIHSMIKISKKHANIVKNSE